MRIDIATLFPEMCEAVFNESIIGRARKNGLIQIEAHNIRDYAAGKHRHVDDTPYGGGKGMLMQAEPIFKCYEDICEKSQSKPHVIYLSPQGQVFRHEKAVELSAKNHLLLLCGHYEGVDERIIEEIVDEEISIGDYVLTGGELGALVLTDSVGRLCDGVLSDSECFEQESHYHGVLEYPQYTRPPEWHGREVPEVLISGHHANIEQWRRKMSLAHTLEKRPDLLEKAPLTDDEKQWIKQLKNK